MTWPQAGPFGTDNPQPIFLLDKPQISNFRPMRKGCSFMVGPVRAVDFDHGLNQTVLPYLQQMLVKLASNTFKGKTNVQFRIVDLHYGQSLYAPSARIVDFRGQENLLGFADKYLLFDEKNLSQAMNHFGITKEQISLAKDNEDLSQQIVSVLDVPANEAQLNFVLAKPLPPALPALSVGPAARGDPAQPGQLRPGLAVLFSPPGTKTE